MRVLVLGAGKMLQAILIGLAQKSELQDWGVYSPSGTSAKLLAAKVGAQFVPDLDQCEEPEIVLIGCKPQQLPSLKETLKGRFNKAIFISVLAAVSESDQRRILGVSQMVRMMPNLPVRSGAGVALFSSESATESLPKLLKDFSDLGLCLAVTEAELEELTLLTGSGPAFFYEFTQLLASSFTSLSEQDREGLARQVLSGAGQAVQADSLPLENMIESVTSKGGVTIAVLEKWRELKLKKLVEEGVDAGKKRTDEIKNLLRQS